MKNLPERLHLMTLSLFKHLPDFDAFVRFTFSIRLVIEGDLGIMCMNIGESPSGKAADFGSAIRRFESFLPSTAGRYPNIVLSKSR